MGQFSFAHVDVLNKDGVHTSADKGSEDRPHGEQEKNQNYFFLAISSPINSQYVQTITLIKQNMWYAIRVLLQVNG